MDGEAKSKSPSLGNFMENPTQFKLKEAKYFFEQMGKTFENDDEFKYNLSAFLSAARSITWFMQGQYAQVEGFGRWYEDKQKEMREDQELKYLDNARVASVHTEFISTGATRVATLGMTCCLEKAKNAPSTNNVDIPQKVDAPQNSESSRPTLPKTVKRFFPEFEEMDIIEYCKRQLDKFEKLVAECEQKFSI